MNTERVNVTVDEDGIAQVRLSRPDKMNALDAGMFEQLVAAGDRLRNESSVRAVVMHGEGRAFCAGLDMACFESLQAGRGLGIAGGSASLADRTRGIANDAQYAAMVWRAVPVPVIAAIHGVAFGGGLQVALGADVRFVAPDARLSVMEIKWGLVPDMAGTLLLSELVRADLVRELTFSGRMVHGEEAVQIGLATRVCSDPLDEAMQFAREIAGRSPSAIRAAKRLLNGASDRDAAGMLLAESTEQDALLGGADQIEAVRANLEKRAPKFSPR